MFTDAWELMLCSSLGSAHSSMELPTCLARYSSEKRISEAALLRNKPSGRINSWADRVTGGAF